MNFNKTFYLAQYIQSTIVSKYHLYLKNSIERYFTFFCFLFLHICCVFCAYSTPHFTRSPIHLKPRPHSRTHTHSLWVSLEWPYPVHWPSPVTCRTSHRYHWARNHLAVTTKALQRHRAAESRMEEGAMSQSFPPPLNFIAPPSSRTDHFLAIVMLPFALSSVGISSLCFPQPLTSFLLLKGVEFLSVVFLESF